MSNIKFHKLIQNPIADSLIEIIVVDDKCIINGLLINNDNFQTSPPFILSVKTLHNLHLIISEFFDKFPIKV